MKVSIIIPFYNEFHLTHQRLLELHRQIPDPIEIVLIDDCSTNDFSNSLGFWETQTHHEVSCYRNEENLGFGGSMNRGCELASGDVFILLSNDVQVLGNFIPLILDELNVNDQVLIGGELHNWDTGWNVLEINGELRHFPYAAGWLIACTREVWNDLGGFDPLFKKFDYEDMDLSTMALHMGYDLVGLDTRMLRHFSGQTVRKYYPDRERITFENRAKFIGKWSTILRDE